MIPQSQEITYHTVTLGPLTRAGHAQADIPWRNEEGEQQTLTLLVPAGLPGERVTIAVEAPPSPRPGRHRRRWRPRPPRVWITALHEPSPSRTEAPCPVFGTCGGCQLQHMLYEAQLEWKYGVVNHLLSEIGAFVDAPLLPPVPCDNPWHYRNHMRFSVNRDGQVGLTVRNSHRVLPLSSCPIAHEQINRVLPILNRHVNERPQTVVRCGAATGQVLIQPVPADEAVQELSASGLDLRSEALEEKLLGETFRIRPSSFFQTNTAQAEKMAHMVLNGLLPQTVQPSFQHRSLTVVDAYCGVGTFALLLSRHVDKVIAIEESSSAIKDAQWNLRDVSNVEILKGKVEAILPTLASRVDGFVIDPPRAGCQQVVLDALIQHPVARIVYVSCEPATLARDLHILCHLHPAYRLCSVQPLDMFPQTAHIECVAVLERVEEKE
jgi:23S rRNA (uracil1939-C5)-methyltransferase